MRDAALRGVRVRLLVDDLYTIGGDPLFIGLAAFPNVEVRLFNPFCCGRDGLLSKYTASLLDFGRLNHRMHNKLFIADGAIVVAGGRNIADEYFMRSMTDNFVDMDAFIVGAVVPQLANIFDTYWNSPHVYPVQDDHRDRARRRDELRREFNRARRRRRPDDGGDAAADRHPGLRPDQRRPRRRAASACSGARRRRSPTRRTRSRRCPTRWRAA